MTDKREKLVAQMLRADHFGGNALFAANQLREVGKTEAAERQYERAQYWLDKSTECRNKLWKLGTAAVQISTA